MIPGARRALPQTLSEGEAVEVLLRVADNVDRWHRVGRVKAVTLQVRLTNLEPSLNTVQIELNGRPLPDSLLQPIDLTYRLLETGGAANPYGYIYEYCLTPEYYPRHGHNRVKVTLLKRDPMLNLPFAVYRVNCSTEYRVHLNFERKPIRY